jgi:ubiquinone/menaquinone biosynthesis C-methylase UbiE
MSKNAFEAWAECYRDAAEAGIELMWPSETLVRLFKGHYVPGLSKDYAGKKLLDVSVGNGNNLIFLATLGLELYGTEVLPDMCTAAMERLAKVNVKVDMRPGLNQSLPFEDNTFDFLTSWNVLHYEPTEADILAALAEYRRVLKPGGRVFVSTTGPEHMILAGAQTLGGHRYQIGREDDFRKGEVFFYFDAPNYIKHYFGQHFQEVLVGRTHDFLLTDTLDWFIVTAVKG